MSTYQLSSVGNVYYKEFIDKELYLQIENGTEEFKKERIALARVKFNDPNIFEVDSAQLERDTNTFFASYVSTVKQVNNSEKIPFGIYDLTYNNTGPCLVESNITKHNIILPIHSELKDIISKCDFKQKNNILIYGEPGNGKTQSIVDLANTIKDLMIVNVIKVEALRYLKHLPAERKKILLFEEFTETMARTEKRMVLNFLDGIDSVPNCISIMSTNYPKDLEANIIDRPSRVRHFLEYKNPTASQIDIICKHFDVKSNFFYNKDYSVDNIINIIKTAKENDMTIKDANNYIADKRKFLSETFKPSNGVMGIGPRTQDDDEDDDDIRPSIGIF